MVCNTALLNANHIPAENLLPPWETIFTAMFMHASIIHIGGNMLFLWIFGNNVEDAMGPGKFLAFYIVGGLAALGLQVAVGPHSTAPTLGASGAIAAVLGGYIVLYPQARVLTLVLIIFFLTVFELPAWVMLGVWFAEQAIFGAVGLTTPHRRWRRGRVLRARRGVPVRVTLRPAAGHEAQVDTSALSRLLSGPVPVG
jgi:membrane associated rhomboid family serine protease